MSTELSEELRTPVVTVVIIFLNMRQYLADAIDSVIRQTYPEWEIILVDDGSTDGATEVAHQYAANHQHRIRYVEHHHHANLGMSVSRNAGLQEARGRYVAFLDADDVYLPERLARHVRILDEYTAVDMVQSDLIFWHSWESDKQRMSDDQVRPFLASSDRILAPPEGLLTVLVAPLFSAGICNITVRRDVALALGGFENRFRGIYEDQVFVSKFYLEKTAYVLQDYLVKYRRHPDSSVRRMKASGEYVEGITNDSTREFHAWLTTYVNSRSVLHPLLQPILAEFTSRRANGRSWVWQNVAGTMLIAFKKVLLNVLPRPAYRRLLQWNWEREVSQALRNYRQLCRRMEKSTFGIRNRGPE